MRALPKIAIARLKANAEAPKSAGTPPGPEAFQGGQHPDANLLSAFAEKTLTERERAQVLSHLARCADCREVIAFIVPAEVLTAEPVRATLGGRSIPWLVLRWGTMAAVLGVLTVVAVMRPGVWNRRQEVSKLSPLPAPAGPAPSARQTISAAPSALPPAPPVRAEAPSAEQESTGKVAATGKLHSSQPGLTPAGHTARPQASQQVTIMASSRPPTEFRAEKGLAVQAAQEESKGGNTFTAVVSPEPSPPPVPAPAPASAGADKSSAETPAGPASLGATSGIVTAPTGVEPSPTAAPNVSMPGGFTAQRSAKVPTTKGAPRTATLETRHMTAQAPMREMAATRKNVEVKAAPLAAYWNVSPDGQVERSTDSGKTFNLVPIAGGIKFMAIAAVGNDVWAGGAGGALYHSSSAGATWNWVGINFAGKAVTEMVTGIQVLDPQHLTVTTASGAQWVSEDGGGSWRKKP